MTQLMCTIHDEFPRDSSPTPSTAAISSTETTTTTKPDQVSSTGETHKHHQIEATEKPILRKPSNYKEYKHNRVSSIVDMTKSEPKETLEDGTCFYLVYDPPMTTKVVATLIENGISKSVVTTVSNLNVSFANTQTSNLAHVYGIPLHGDCTWCDDSPTKEIHVSTKECSVSSGVGSGESSELDSPVPKGYSITNKPTYTRSLLTAKKQQQQQHPSRLHSAMENNTKSARKTRTQSTQTDKSMNPSVNIRQTKQRSSLDSPLTSSRRDSGFSSPSSPNYASNNGSSKSTCGHTNCNINYEKEALLADIKRRMYDPEKEIYMQEIRQFLKNTGEPSFTKQSSALSWRPIKESAPLRGVLKCNPSKLLEEIQTRHNMKALERARKEKSMLCPLKRSEVVDIIKQVQKCLTITQHQRTRKNSPLECKFQVHRKIKLKSFPYGVDGIDCRTKCRPKSTTSNINDNNIERRSSAGYSIHLDYFSKQLQQAASRGDIKTILEVINSNPTVLDDTQGRGWPAFHHAFKKQHYRTAMLLFEAGTNLEVYTEQRVQEYQQMMEIVNRNKKFLP